MASLPPLPDDFEPYFHRAYTKITELAENMRVKKTFRVTNVNSSNQLLDLLIPVHKISMVIGQHGETLKRLESLSQAKILFDPHFSEDIENVPHRKCTITGTAMNIEEARRLVLDRIENSYSENRYNTIYVPIPLSKVGLLIGKGGETIRELQERSSAKVQVVMESVIDPHSTERLVSITGDQENINKAKQMVEDIINQTGRVGAFIPSLSGKGHQATVQIPDVAVGCIIGRKAENLKQIQALSATKIFVDTSPTASGPTRTVTISGPTPEATSYAQKLIEEKVNSHMVTLQVAGGLDPGQPGFVYQNPSDLLNNLYFNTF